MYKLLPILLFAYSLALTTDDIYDNSWALIIGIDKYQNVQSLDYAVNDAKDIQNMLVGKFQFPKDNIRLLINEEATRASILQEFSNITKKAGTNDRVLIFFAGHGKTEDLPAGGEIGYLLPVDANDDLYLSSINMDEIKTLSLRSEAKHILYLIDACYGGIISVGARNAGNFMMWGEYDYETTQDYFEKTTKTNFFQKITQDKSRQIITAGGRDEIAQEKAEWGHSAFTKNLLSGLRDSKADINTDGYITSQELGSYLKKKVTIDTNKKQTPKIRDLSSDEGEFVFILPEANNATKTNAALAEDNNSRDEQLDLILSKLNELESQKNLDTPVKKQNNNIENVGMSGPYWQREFGAGFMSTSTNTTLELYNIINDHLEISLQYEHFIDKISSSLSGTHSNQMHVGQLSLIYSYVFKERYRFLLGGGLGYAQVLWADSSHDFNYFKTSAIGGLGMKFIKITKPISTQIGCKLLFELSDQPHLDENGKAIFDKKIEIEPKIIFLISFPK